MLVIRGTKKFRDRIAGAPVGPHESGTTTLGAWFATVLFWRPQVVMLVNERTLLPVLVPFAPSATLLSRVPATIVSILRRHGVPEPFITAEAEAMAEVRLGPTNSRSIVGVVNELSSHAGWRWRSGLRDLDELSMELAAVPLGPLYGRHGTPGRELAGITAAWQPSPGGRHLQIVPPVAAVPTTEPARSIYQLKVSLLDTNPPIWRRLLVPAELSLDGLHETLQAAFGWWNYHLHAFEVGVDRYGVPDADDWDPPRDERGVQLRSLVREGSKFRYVYDFGDDWRHEINVEKVLAAEPALNLPACVDGRRAGPPEDCGGPWGYAELLSILADPTHPEHAERLAWLGGGFDPDAFDPANLPGPSRAPL